MMALTKIRELEVSAPASARRHLSAASGLVRAGAFLYIVADDELHLGVFRVADSGPGHLVRLFEGALPDTKSERKKHKPDLEVLALLPPHGNCPHGALLALGSGSRSNRRRAAMLKLDASGAVGETPAAVDLAPFFAPLDAVFAEVNIEGAVVSGAELRLFQRGNNRHPENAIITFPLSPLLAALSSGQIGAIAPSVIRHLDLGQFGGIPYCFTDAARLPDGEVIFTAIAEDTGNAYDDGPCVAAAIGMTESDGALRWLRQLDRPYKVEGVDARADGNSVTLLLVTDADDPDIPASLFSATIET
jgi:hypothetical protein